MPTPNLENEYQSALVDLQTAMAPATALDHKISRAVSAINMEVEAKKRNNESPDYRFYTSVLADLNHISSHPTDKIAAAHLGMLAKEGPSRGVGKQIIEALLGVLGVLLIMASIACLVTTFGGSSFASAFGIALGLSLLQSKITLGLTAASLGILGGGLIYTFWNGSISSNDVRQGFSKELEAVKEEVLQPTPV